MKYPAAIVFINDDLSSFVQSTLVKQLYAAEAITGEEFDARVAADPTYATAVRQAGLRVLVIRDLSDTTNRELADVVIFVKAGLASVLETKFGPPGLTLPISTLYIYRLVNNY